MASLPQDILSLTITITHSYNERKTAVATSESESCVTGSFEILLAGPVALTLSSRVGFGAYGQVFKAFEPDGRVVAVKKSRVSSTVTRTLLQHEAHIICLLHGHPAIPQVYALGRVGHFEYLSMELLGDVFDHCNDQSLELRTSSVALIASQMVSALQHIHTHGIVHRDIKPENMLPRLSKPFQIQLIDFGIARTLPDNMGSVSPDDDPTRPVVGTLTYASLNAHFRLPLTRRDDLESLAYSLFAFLRKDQLPWNKQYPLSAPIAFIRRQVREAKRSWSGKRLADNHEPAFGTFLEEVRGMTFEADFDYPAWVEMFSKLVKLPVELPSGPSSSKHEDLNVGKFPNPQRPREPPVRPGQLVYARILPKASIEGYTSSRPPLCEWQDPTLSDITWPTTFLPAIVLDISETSRRKWSVSLISLTRCKPNAGTRMLIRGGDGIPGDVTVLGEDWPEGDHWCDNTYVKNTFLWTPDQVVPLRPHWNVSQRGLDILRSGLGKPDPDFRPLSPRQLWSLEYQDLYVEGKELNPGTMGLEAVDWRSCHGWLAEFIPIVARWAHDAWMGWLTCDEPEPEIEVVLDSYGGEDLDDWEVQKERAKSATVGTEMEISLEGQLGKILAIT